MSMTNPLQTGSDASVTEARVEAGKFGRQLREARRVRLRDFAKTVGVPRATISRIERGRQPGMDAGRKLGKAIGVCPCCGQDWRSP